MRAEHVLAIDQGTSATKAVVVDREGAVVALAEVPVVVTASVDGAVELEPESLWRSVVEAGTRAVAMAGVTIAAVGVANQGETVVAWDRRTGKPEGPAIVWQDGRSSAVCDRLRVDGYGDLVRERSGLELDPYFVAPKVRWLRDSGSRADVITTTDTWLLHRLCGGVFVTDAATASRTALLDLDSGTWSAELVDAFGLRDEVLPEIVACDRVVGETSVFGGPAVPVGGLIVDQQAALFAESCLRPGDAKCTYGTGAFLLTNSGASPIRSTTGLVACIAWLLDDGTRTYCLDGQVFTVGAVVRWLAEIGLITGPEDLDRLGSTVGDCGGVTFVPALAGLGAPFWSAGARGSFTGLSLATTRAHLVRAVVEGIAAQVAALVEAVAVDLGAPLQRLRVDGGLTRSATLLQIQADLLGIPVEVYPSPHATALGVAALTWRAIDRLHPGFTWSPVSVNVPRVSADEAEARRNAWRNVADQVAAAGR